MLLFTGNNAVLEDSVFHEGACSACFLLVDELLLKDVLQKIFPETQTECSSLFLT